MRRVLVYNGQLVSASDLARAKNIPVATLISRIDQLGWSVERAADTPIKAKFRRGGRRPSGGVKPCPRLEHHKASGKGRCRWYEAGGRREKWFGVWGSEACKAAYARFAAEWAEYHGRPPAPGRRLLVVELVTLFRNWAESPAGFSKAGRPTSEVYAYRSACKTLVELFGDAPADDFRPAALRAVRSAWAKTLSRGVANRYAAKVVRVFAWGVGRELVAGGVLAPLREVEPLRAGRDATPDPEPVGPADPDAVAKALAAIHPDPVRAAVLAAMIEVQLAAGTRPAVVCALRVGHIDRTKTPWVCNLTADLANKNLHKGKALVVYFGPRARAALEPHLAGKAPTEFVFTFPRERNVKRGPRPLTRHEYGRLVAAACRRAGVEPWTPNQLRHLRATEIMDEYESAGDAASVLGNSPEVLRRVYADDPGGAAARRIAEQTG